MTALKFSVHGAATIQDNIATASMLMVQAPDHYITPQFVDATEQDIEGTERALAVTNELIEDLSQDLDGTERSLELSNEYIEQLEQALADIKQAHTVVMETLSAIGINVAYARETQELKVVIDPETFRGTITG